MDKVTEASNCLRLCLKFFRRFLPPTSNCPRKVSVISVTCYAVHTLCLIYLKCSVTGTTPMQTDSDSNWTPCNTPHGICTSPVSISVSPAQKEHLFSKNSWFHFLFLGAQPIVGQGLLVTATSISHSIIHTTLGRVPLDERSARRRDLYLTTHNTHKKETSMTPVGFDPQYQKASRRRSTP
jgi:hypothetical protein